MIILSARNSKAKMVLAQRLQWNLLDDVLINWGWHFDFMDLGFHSVDNWGLKLVINQLKREVALISKWKLTA